MVSAAHAVCAKGLYVAIVSTTVETKNPVEELQPGLDLLGDILEQFTSVSDLFVPIHNGLKNRLFITESYDATSHFESASDDVMEIYKRIMGEELDLTVLPSADEEDK